MRNENIHQKNLKYTKMNFLHCVLKYDSLKLMHKSKNLPGFFLEGGSTMIDQLWW